jgi:hypothetical protein
MHVLSDSTGDYMDRHRPLFTIAALGCFSISLLHILLSFGGIRINRFFGAPSGILQLITEGSWLFPAMALGITLLFGVLGLYALSGAERFRRLPLLKSINLLLGLILTYRGTAIVISIQNILKNPDYSTWQFPLMSLGSLILGLITLWGTLDLLKYQRKQRLAMAANL